MTDTAKVYVTRNPKLRSMSCQIAWLTFFWEFMAICLGISVWSPIYIRTRPKNSNPGSRFKNDFWPKMPSMINQTVLISIWPSWIAEHSWQIPFAKNNLVSFFKKFVRRIHILHVNDVHMRIQHIKGSNIELRYNQGSQNWWPSES